MAEVKKTAATAKKAAAPKAAAKKEAPAKKNRCSQGNIGICEINRRNICNRKT